MEKLPKPYYEDVQAGITIYHGDCREILPLIRGISAVVTDPPYEIGFMGKSWDNKGIGFQPETWAQIRRACLPGAMLLAFGGTRTFHRIACAIEDGGWELRDTLMWVYGSGFPKSLDIGKAVDKLQGNEREVIGKSNRHNSYAQSIIINPQGKGGIPDLTKGASVWEGYGTALKPAWEPITIAMNPLDGTFANNALKHGVAGLNIEGCRIGVNGGGTRCNNRGGDGKCLGHPDRSGTAFGLTYHTEDVKEPQGRFPANLIHDGSQAVMELFPQTGKSSGGGMKDLQKGDLFQGETNPNITNHTGFGDNGSAARFFYCAKASRSERNKGMEGFYQLKRDIPLEAITEIEQTLARS